MGHCVQAVQLEGWWLYSSEKFLHGFNPSHNEPGECLVPVGTAEGLEDV